MSEKVEVIKQFEDGKLSCIPNAEDIFLLENGVKPVYDAVVEKLHADVVGLDPTKKKDQKAIRSIASNGRKSKTFIDKIGGEVKKKYLAPAENIDPNRRQARHNIDKAIEEILAPVIAEEQKVERKAQALKDAISSLDAISVKEIEGVSLTADQLKAMMVELNETTFETLSERYDIEGKHIEINSTKAACIKRLEDHIESRERFEADQAELEEKRRKEQQENLIADNFSALRNLVKVEDGLDSIAYESAITRIKRIVIDDRYGDRTEDAQDIKDLAIIKLERAVLNAKEEEAKIVKPTIDNKAIDAEFDRWKSLAKEYIATGGDALQRAIKGLSLKELDGTVFGERITEATLLKQSLIKKMKDSVTTPAEEVVSEEPKEISLKIAEAISDILGTDLSDSYLVVESILEGELSNYLELK